VHLNEPVEVVPAVLPVFGAEAVSDQPLLDDPAAYVVSVTALADCPDGAAIVTVGPAVSFGQVHQGVVAEAFFRLCVQAADAGDLLYLVAGIISEAARAASAVLYADQPA